LIFRGIIIGVNDSIIISPANNSQLDATTITFKKNTGSGVTSTYLFVGYSQGSNEIFGNYVNEDSFDIDVSKADGKTIYVRLWRQISGSWKFIDYSYEVHSVTTSSSSVSSDNDSNSGNTNVELVSSNNNTTIAKNNLTFLFNPLYKTASNKLIQIGATKGSTEIFSGYSQSDTLSIDTLNTNKENLHVTVWYLMNGSWKLEEFTFKVGSHSSVSSSQSSVAVSSSSSMPSSNSSQSSSSVASATNNVTLIAANNNIVIAKKNLLFTFDPALVSPDNIIFKLGTYKEGNDLFQVYTREDSVSVTSLEASSSLIYATVSYLKGGRWTLHEFTFTLSDLIGGANSSTNNSSSSVASKNHAPVVTFLSHKDSDVIKLDSLSNIIIKVNAYDVDNNFKGYEITSASESFEVLQTDVVGEYDVHWTPSHFGEFNIDFMLYDELGAKTEKSITLHVTQNTQGSSKKPTFETRELGVIEHTKPSEIKDSFLVYGKDDGKGADLVLVAEGFQANEMDRFYNTAKAFADAFIAKETIKEHNTAWNIHFMALPSNESGADGYYGENDTQDTRYNAHYYCQGIKRLICVDNSKVFSETARYVPQYDEIIVVVNAYDRGGSGSSGLAVVSIGGQAKDTMVHELGHSFAGLADEYNYGGSGTFSYEPSYKNVTIQTDPSKVKWKHFFDRDYSDVVIDEGSGATVGLFEGAEYVATGIYRPTRTSIMENVASPFYKVNAEQWAISIYGYVKPIYKTLPTSNIVTQNIASASWYMVEPYFSKEKHTIEWSIDGEIVSSSAEDAFALEYTPTSKGSHTIKATVRDNTGLIVRDDYARSIESKTWTVTVN